jgi:hypothetical protein
MSQTNRRIFMLSLVAGSSALAASAARAQAALPESDAQAVALGYKVDTTKVDKKKYPKHEDSQTCANCQLYQGKPADAAGGCPLFPGKTVTKNGWCSAWVKKG